MNNKERQEAEASGRVWRQYVHLNLGREEIGDRILSLSLSSIWRKKCEGSHRGVKKHRTDFSPHRPLRRENTRQYNVGSDVGQIHKQNKSVAFQAPSPFCLPSYLLVLLISGNLIQSFPNTPVFIYFFSRGPGTHTKNEYSLINQDLDCVRSWAKYFKASIFIPYENSWEMSTSCRKLRLRLSQNIEEVGVFLKQSSPGKDFLSASLKSHFKDSKLILFWRDSTCLTIFTNLIAILWCLLLQGKLMWMRTNVEAVATKSAVGPSREENEPREQLKIQFIFPHWDDATYQMKNTRFPTMLPTLALGLAPPWRWRIRHIRASFSHLSARNHWEGQCSFFQ